jgi:hypothetical protein
MAVRAGRVFMPLVDSGLALLEVLDQHDIASLNSLAEGQVLPVRGPIEAEKTQSLKMCYLIGRASMDGLSPNVVAVIPAVNVIQLAIVETPAKASRNSNGEGDWKHLRR